METRHPRRTSIYAGDVVGAVALSVTLVACGTPGDDADPVRDEDVSTDTERVADAGADTTEPSDSSETVLDTDTADATGDAPGDGTDVAHQDVDARPRSEPEYVGSWGGRGRDPGEFIEPSSVAMDSEGHVYVAGHENRFQKFDKSGELLAIHGSPGSGDGEFNHPHGIAVDHERGDLIYVGDQENHRLQVFEPDGSFLRKMGSDKLEHIHDIGLAPSSGAAYVGDFEDDVVRKFSSDGQLVATYGGTGSEPGKFDGAWGVATDTEGNIYVGDSRNGRVQKLGPDGSFIDAWSEYRGTPFSEPTGVYVDAEGIVYVVDTRREEIALLERDGTPVDKWDLGAITGLETEPEDVVVGESGTHIYIGEVRGHRILHLRRQ